MRRLDGAAPSRAARLGSNPFNTGISLFNTGISLFFAGLLGFMLPSPGFSQPAGDVGSSSPGPRASHAIPYTPPLGAWERRTPESLGLAPEAIAEAIRIAQTRVSTTPTDLALNHQRSFGREPFGDAIGPFRARGEASGVIVHQGYIVGEWGDPDRVDVTFSVAKSFLSSTVGLAWDRGWIGDLEAPVGPSMAPIQPQSPACVAPRQPEGAFPQVAPPFEPFATPHNAPITWRHLLQQSSDWEGMLWCKPDWADRPDRDPDTWGTRPRTEPGSVFQYNDVRVNLLALAAQNVVRNPLPELLRDALMDPIGASRTWRWMGYENSWILLDGRWVQVVSGGSHWGGGLFISAFDMARFGLLHLRDGLWGDARVLSSEWIRMASTPSPSNEGYGFMNFYLNTGRRALPSAPESAVHHLGAGTNMIYVDRENDFVIVARWIQQNAMNEIVEAALASRPGS